MADIDASINAEGVKDVDEVVSVGVERSVSAEIKVVRVNAAGTNEVVEDELEL